MRNKIIVSAGEVSGDMHAASVIREIHWRNPHINISGMGSKHLSREGVEVIIDPLKLSSVGFTEPLKNIKKHLKHLKLMKKHIAVEKPDAVLLVDYTGFNMLLARAAYKYKIPVVSYFSPSAWIWGEWRAGWMARYRATIAAVFPMEAVVYNKAGARVRFVGHPLVDMIKSRKSNQDKSHIYKSLELDPEKMIIGLLPGSRRQEVESLLPVMLKTAEKLQKREENYQFILPAAPGIDRSDIAKKALEYNLILKVVEGMSREVMQAADFILTASGTAALEASLFEIPMIIIYKVSKGSYFLGKRLLKPDFIGLPNLIMNQEIVPEFIQDEVNSDKIFSKTVEILNDENKYKKMKEDLKMVANKLGKSGAAERTAELLLREGKLI